MSMCFSLLALNHNYLQCQCVSIIFKLTISTLSMCFSHLFQLIISSLFLHIIISTMSMYFYHLSVDHIHFVDVFLSFFQLTTSSLFSHCIISTISMCFAFFFFLQLTTNIELESDEIIFIMENCLVFLLILCRWLLPRGEITRDQLSQLLFVFIGEEILLGLQFVVNFKYS